MATTLRVVSYPDPTLPEKKGLVTIRHPTQPSDVSRLACEMTDHSTVRVISSAMRSRGIDNISYMAFVSTWSLTMVFGYAPLGSGGISYCNQTPFPLHEDGVWARDYTTGRAHPSHYAGQLAIHVCISIAPRPMTVIFGLGTRLRVCMHTKVEKVASQPMGSSSSVL